MEWGGVHWNYQRSLGKQKSFIAPFPLPWRPLFKTNSYYFIEFNNFHVITPSSLWFKSNPTTWILQDLQKMKKLTKLSDSSLQTFV